jgi:hypothetical protein
LEAAYSAPKVINSLSMFDAVIWLRDALKQVLAETVEQCFYKTKLSVSAFSEKKQTKTSRLFTYHLIRLCLKMLWEYIPSTLMLTLTLKLLKERDEFVEYHKQASSRERESVRVCACLRASKKGSGSRFEGGEI